MYPCDGEMECRQFRFPSGEFPQTNEDLQEICMPAIGTMECRIRYVEECERRDADELELSYKILAIVKDICSEDTLLHAAIVENLKCFSNLVDDESKFCAVADDENIEKFAEALREEGIISLTDNVNDTYSLYECIRMMTFFSCHALHLERECGTVAMDAYLEVVQRLGPCAFGSSCDNSYDLLPAIIRLSKLEENIVEAIKKRK